MVLPHRLWIMLAFTRIPGNAFSFWIRKTLRWSRGAPQALPHEPKEDLFAYLTEASEGSEGSEKPAADGKPEAKEAAGLPSEARQAAEAREHNLRERYALAPLAAASTRALYRKNLYLIDILDDILEKAGAGLSFPAQEDGALRAMDVGSQDWHYVFGLERWLRYAGGGAQPLLKGVEVDGYGVYPDFRSRKDYAQAYAAQTENPQVTYEVLDFMKVERGGYDVLTLFYPFVTRHHLLLWGLPLNLFRPAGLLAKAAAITRPGGWMVVFTHTLKEHELFLDLGRNSGAYDLLREGRALSKLVDFYEEVEDRRFSIWRRKS